MDSLVSTEWLQKHGHEPGLVVLDCTVVTVAERGGGMHSVSGRDEHGQGHIGGPAKVFGVGLLDETGRMRPDGELAAVCVGDRDARHITYCGGGILASLNAFAMTRLGYSGVAAYTASLRERAADPGSPMTDALS